MIMMSRFHRYLMLSVLGVLCFFSVCLIYTTTELNFQRPNDIRNQQQLHMRQQYAGEKVSKTAQTDGLVVVIGIFSTSSVDDAKFRLVHRRTHFRYENVGRKVVMKFVIGQPKNSSELIAIRKENRTFGDLVLLDQPENMNHGKSYFWWQYAAKHFPLASFYAKADLDTYIWTNTLEKQLWQLRHQHFIYYGRFSCGKNHPDECLRHSKFVSGGFQVLSADITFWIVDPLNHFVRNRLNGYEDELTGVWMHRGHRFINLKSPCPDQVEYIKKIYNNETCGNVFMHWMKKTQDFVDLYDNNLQRVIDRQNIEIEKAEKLAVFGRENVK